MLPKRALPPALLALCLVLAGCSGVLPTIVRHDVTVTNEDDSSHVVTVTITEGDSTVLDETNRIDAGGVWRVTNLTDAGDYRVVVQTQSGAETNESFTLPLAEGDRKSFLHVRIEEDSSLDGDVFWQD